MQCYEQYIIIAQFVNIESRYKLMKKESSLQ